MIKILERKQYFLSHLEIVKDETKEILRRNRIQTRLLHIYGVKYRIEIYFLVFK